MGITFANESPAYRAARDRLLAAEIALRRQMEAVAEQRRNLPPGPSIAEDYAFESADGAERVRLSELFRPDSDTLLIYAYMFPRHSGDRRAVDGDRFCISFRMCNIVKGLAAIYGAIRSRPVDKACRKSTNIKSQQPVVFRYWIRNVSGTRSDFHSGSMAICHTNASSARFNAA